MNKAILYSFRRCPYAMRARLAIAVSGVQVVLREVELRDKPQALLDLSPKATVPVLVTVEKTVIDESIDIMFWALRQGDSADNLETLNELDLNTAKQMIHHNDNEFKYYLDRYKYADRYPQESQHYYRQQAERTLLILEKKLAQNTYLLTSTLSLADLAIFPFIRQFAFVDKTWFDASPYPHLKRWLEVLISMPLFELIMTKYPKWQQDDLDQFFPDNQDI